MKETDYPHKARALIEEARSGSPSDEQRCDQAIKLASYLLPWAETTMTWGERYQQRQLSGMMKAKSGKVFTTSMTDQCFRSHDPARIADQLSYLLRYYGVPTFLAWYERAAFALFRQLAWRWPKIFVPATQKLLRREASRVILPGDRKLLKQHLEKRYEQNVRVNLNHLGEAILGEEEAQRRLSTYLTDLSQPEIEYISVKVSTIFSQINLLSWEESLAILKERLAQLYRQAAAYRFTRSDGTQVPKFVNLDMEEYRDLHLTVELFQSVLDQPEFFSHSAGIVLQAYLPDSYDVQVHLTQWAQERVNQGGAPIKMRLVKGANLAMEKVSSDLNRWEQPPYSCKEDSDANFKKMLLYGADPQRASAVHLGIGSHNLFDISYALLLTAEKGIERYVTFEMLEGMANHLRRVVQEIAGDILLYCPAASAHEFHSAIAYLIRRLDENTGPQHYLKDSFGIQLGSPAWKEQEALFRLACKNIHSVSTKPRRTQDRRKPPTHLSPRRAFDNEPTTDWALPANRQWIHDLVDRWPQDCVYEVPLVINGEESSGNAGERIICDPSSPDKPCFRYPLADAIQAEQTVASAVTAQQSWETVSAGERAELLQSVARSLRERRTQLMSAMMFSCAKTAEEADVEIAEAIDFVEYYWRQQLELEACPDIAWKPKGVILLAPPWNFPTAIPIGGLCAALAGGNSVIFKPAPEAVLVGWELAQALWNAGVSKKVMQFICCDDKSVGSLLVKDPRISSIILTGASETAKHFLQMRPSLDLLAETGGKNSIIVSKMADRDLAVHDVIHSAFGHSGQKCSACSLLICESEVYNDPIFLRQLVDAAKSLHVGPAWDLKTRINPLIRKPGKALHKALTHLDDGEQWLLTPQQDPKNPNLWSPGIKIGVAEQSFSHQTEFFGPVLSILCAKSLQDAIRIANNTPYGLTAGLHSLDPREQKYWKQHIEAGNCYINRGITGAVVRRQPFGGYKESSFGPGAKAGGPNYLPLMMHPHQRGMPEKQETPPEFLDQWQPSKLNDEELYIWKSSLASYTYHWNHHFSQAHDPSHILGEDNTLEYLPRTLTLRINDNDSALDAGRVCAATALCQSPLEVSGTANNLRRIFGLRQQCPYSNVTVKIESEQEFLDRIGNERWQCIRHLSTPSSAAEKLYAQIGAKVLLRPVLANGRFEMVQYLRQRTVSFSYHRYGNLGERELSSR